MTLDKCHVMENIFLKILIYNMPMYNLFYFRYSVFLFSDSIKKMARAHGTNCRPCAQHSGIGRPIILFYFLLSYMGQAQPAFSFFGRILLKKCSRSVRAAGRRPLGPSASFLLCFVYFRLCLVPHCLAFDL